MKINTIHFDPLQAIFTILTVLMMVGKIPYNRKTVGGLLILSKCKAEFTWERR